jgi:competence protein ComEC
MSEVPQSWEELSRVGAENVQIFSILVLQAFLLIMVCIRDVGSNQKALGFTSQKQYLNVKILDISKSKGDRQEVIFKIEDLRGVGYVEWFEEIKIGDVCELSGDISIPENFDDFDYRGYLRNKKIYLYGNRLKFKNCNFIFDSGDIGEYPILLKRALRELRYRLSLNIEKNMPEPQSSLLIGILFGSQRAFSDDFEKELRISGTTHIIAASGYNVTILILLCNRVFSFLNKKFRLIISLLVIWLFCIFSGLSASILRATVMGSITIFALISGNVRNIHLLIPMGIFFLILINPRILFDIGFQLSILATLGLVYLLPSIVEFLKSIFKVKELKKWVEEYILGTLSCTLATLPVSISIFGKVSLVSVFANILILPLTESTMLYGFVALIISFISNSFSKYIFSIPYFQLKIFEYIVSFFGSIKWAYVDINISIIGILIGVSLVIFCIYYYPVDGENYYIKKYYDI